MNTTLTLQDRSLTWQPIFDVPIALQPVAPDARRVDERLAHYQQCAIAMRTTPSERYKIVEVLQWLECTHGATAVLPPLPRLTVTLSAAVACLGQALTELALQRGYPHAGVFVGALLEAQLSNAASRRIPLSAFHSRSTSPHLEFEDITAGSNVLASLVTANDLDEKAVRAAGAIVHAIRQALGAHTEAALQTLSHSGDSLHLVRAVDALAQRHHINLPPAWRRFRQQALNQEANS
jgi:hypothetical protein